MQKLAMIRSMVFPDGYAERPQAPVVRGREDGESRIEHRRRFETHQLGFHEPGFAVVAKPAQNLEQNDVTDDDLIAALPDQALPQFRLTCRHIVQTIDDDRAIDHYHFDFRSSRKS